MRTSWATAAAGAAVAMTMAATMYKGSVGVQTSAGVYKQTPGTV